jgi:hypothetical protein
VFPVRYELNSYILLRRNSVFKGLNSALDVGEWSASRPGRFIPGKRTPVFGRRLGGTQNRYGN